MNAPRGDARPPSTGIRVAGLASWHTARVALFGGAQLLVPASPNLGLDVLLRTLVFVASFQWLFRPARRDLERLAARHGPRVYLLAAPGALATLACVWLLRSRS